jgi:hypothetical protein
LTAIWKNFDFLSAYGSNLGLFFISVMFNENELSIGLLGLTLLALSYVFSTLGLVLDDLFLIIS